MKMINGSRTLILGLLLNGIILGSASAQSIVDVVPSPNETAAPPTTAIAGTLKSGNNISIPTNTVKIWVDGKDVTSQSGINSTAFRYTPQSPLTPGKHTARVEFRGSDGIARFVTWDFNVSTNPQVQVVQSAIAIQSISHNAAEGLGSGSVFQTTMQGTANQKASVLLIRADSGSKAMQEIAAREVSPGEYIASFTVGSAPLNEGIVLGRLAGNENKDVAYAVAKSPARFNLSTSTPKTDPTTQIAEPENTHALKPAFNSHKDGDRIPSRNGFILKGQTKPGAVVRVKVRSASRSLGGILGSIVSGDLLLDKSVTADSEGNFEVAVPRPLIVNKGTRYQVEAIAELDSAQSQPVSMELIQD